MKNPKLRVESVFFILQGLFSNLTQITRAIEVLTL